MTPGASADQEPWYDPNEPEVWIHWAREELVRRERAAADARYELRRAITRAQEAEEKVRAYKSVFENEERLKILEPGRTVYVGRNADREAVVQEIRIRVGNSVEYRVGWWDNNALWLEAWLPAPMVAENAPLPKPPGILPE